MKRDVFSNAVFERAVAFASELPPSDLPEIVFSGRSNVGKSSLINKILGRKSLARVSRTPGKTATVNFYNVGGFRLVDLPGYGYARVSGGEKRRWGDVCEEYFRSGRNVSLVVQLVDMRRPPTGDDRDMFYFLRQNGFPFAVVLTKSDKLNKAGYSEALERAKSDPDLSQIAVIPFSAVTGDGVGAVRSLLIKYEG